MRYLDFMQRLTKARLVVTNSGGVQQESFIHERPAVTVRDNTEWLETVERKCNRLSGASDKDRIAAAIIDASNEPDTNWGPIFGDGTAAKQIVAHCTDYLAKLNA